MSKHIRYHLTPYVRSLCSMIETKIGSDITLGYSYAPGGPMARAYADDLDEYNPAEGIDYIDALWTLAERYGFERPDDDEDDEPIAAERPREPARAAS